MKSLLVLGVGNLLLTDDGVGVLAAQQLMEESWPENVTIREAGTFTQDVFYTFEGFSHILVLDVVHGKGEPGSLYRLGKEQLIHDDSQRLSLHDIDLLDSLRMAELYFKRPLNLTVIGMEPQDFTTWNMGLSPTVAARFETYLDVVRQEIRDLSHRLIQE